MTTSSFDERSAEVKEHERRAAVILDGMYQFVALLNASGDILEVNRAALEGAGHQIQEIRGTPFWSARWWQISEQTQADLQAAIRRAAAGEFVRYEVDIYGEQSGRAPITIDFSLQPIPGASGEVEYLLPEGRNITERKRAEEQVARQAQELRVLNERLKELGRLKTQFFANVSHEFRTPLTLMLGPLEDALANAHGILPLGAAKDLEVSHRNALRLLKLVNTMLDFSRIEAGRVQASYQPTDLAALTAELTSNFRSACDKAGLRLVVECPPLSTSAQVYVDRDMWEKIVLNLVSNAFKFTLKGHIGVRLEAAEGQACLTVCDTGVGIPFDELPHMFERFHRIKDSRGHTHEGTGIGLALVQELVKLHGGTVRVDSVLGEGSTFTVTIPLGKEHLDPQRIGKAPELASTAIASSAFVEEVLRWLPDDGSEPSAGEPPFAPALASSDRDLPGGEPEGQRARILWADDNADMREYVSRLLAGRFDVQAVADGQAALEAARANPPDLVLSDVMMPRLDGFGLLHELRADPQLREIPVILLSARAGEESRIEGMEAHADDYLIKPFSARELLARVESHARMARFRREADAAIREAERRLSTLISSLPGMVYRRRNDRNWTMAFVSAGVTDITGYTPDDFTSGRIDWTQLQHPDDVGWTWEAVQSAAREHQPFQFEYRLRHKDGSERWTWEQGQGMYNGANEPFAFEGFVADITERKRAEQATALLGAIVDSSDDAIISKGLDGVITSWNKSAERLFGYTASEAVGQPITMLIPPERLDEEPQILERLKRGERVDHFETIRVCKDGSRLDISLTISPVKDADGRIVGASKVARDITERKQAEEALRQSHVELRVHMDEMARFNRVAVGREMRIIELKQEVNELRERQGEGARYALELEPVQAERLAVSRLPGEEGDGLVPLESILCTEELNQRPKRAPDYETENRALAVLIQALADSPRTILQTLADKVLEVLRADSAGLSLLTKDGKRFHWAAIAGAWRPHIGGGTPRDFGPCGDVLDRNVPLLFSHWERRYPYLLSATPLAEEGLLVPFYVAGRAVGTIWAIAHDDWRKFDAQDLRLLESLGRFASAAYQAVESLDAFEQRRAALSLMEEAVQARHLVESLNGQLRSEIAERMAAEQALQQARATLEQRVEERTALLALIQDVTRAANEAPSSAAALQFAVDHLCAAMGWPVGHVYLAVAPGAHRWAPTALWHLDDPERFTAFQQATQGLECAAGEGLIGRVGTRGQPEWLREVATDLALQHQRAAQAAGLRTGVAWPVLVGHEVAGVLAFYAPEPLAPNPALLEAMTQIGTQLGRAIERERAAAQAQRQQEALLQQEKLAAMSTMLASVAHELNNPLATIVLQADLLREEAGRGPLADPATEIVQAAVRCERLVRQFLTLARQHPPDRATVALNTLVTETVELLAYPLRIDNVAVHLHLDEQVPPLWGDPHQLQQVLLNLLTNAQHALRAAPGVREVTCTTQYDPTSQQITLTVADTGPGIPPALQARIFEPFFTTKPPGVGTGLGLPLCRGMVEAHGGTLEVTSAPGHGATFRLTLPLGAVPALSPVPLDADAGPAGRAHTILIVDDELSLAKGLARLLKRDGHTVDTVANGRLAVSKLDEGAYDLILCDMRMPELDGPSLYRLLKRQHPHLCPRFIFLTGDTLEPATQEFLVQSGTPCLTKPFAIAEARRAIQHVLGVAAR